MSFCYLLAFPINMIFASVLEDFKTWKILMLSDRCESKNILMHNFKNMIELTWDIRAFQALNIHQSTKANQSMVKD